MTRPRYIVVTLHCPRGFPSGLLLDEAERLPVQTMTAGFSQMILVFALSAVWAARNFAARADGLRRTDSAYKHLQVGVAAGTLQEPLSRPMPDDDEVVIKAFKTGLSQTGLSEEFEKIEHATS